MKTRNIILLALTALLAVSCHSWDDPAEDAGMNSYGNKDLKESNVVQISDLLTKYKNEVTSENIKQITDACQIKGIVTSNDEGGNIYKNLYVVDGTGGLCLKIDKTSLYAEAADGQCVLVNLKGLWIGSYGLQPQIGGTPYTNNSGKLVIGNINRNTWAEHYKLIPDIEGLSAKPITTNDMSALDMDKDFGKVVTLVGIKMKKADGTTVFAPSASGSDNQKVAGQASPVFIRTSTFAKFAKMVMPTGQFNITGVITRYNNDWQILPRAIRDIQEYTGSETLDYKVDFTQPDPEGEGTAAKPFNVIAAANKCEEIGTTISKEKYYVKGYVMEDVTVSSYGNASFEIADTKMGGERFTAFQVAGSDGKKMTEGYKINKGDEVVIYGAMYNYSGYKPETDGKGAAYIVTINGKKTDGSGGGGGEPTPSEGNVTTSVDGAVVTLTNTTVTASTNTVSVDLNEQGWEDTKEPTAVTLNDGTTIVFSKGEGGSTPKFYANTKGVRMYAKNTIVITGASKAIAKVVLNCDSYGGTDYVGNTTLFGSASDNKLTVVNEHTGTSGGTQLRVKTIDITYAQ